MKKKETRALMLVRLLQLTLCRSWPGTHRATNSGPSAIYRAWLLLWMRIANTCRKYRIFQSGLSWSVKSRYFTVVKKPVVSLLPARSWETGMKPKLLSSN